MGEENKEEKLNRNDIGISGEFYMAYILSKHGFQVNLTLGRTAGFDLFAQNKSGVNMTISVKTTYKRVNKFILLDKKVETLINNHLYYAFVRLNGLEGVPDFWIVPSTIVAPVVKKSHEIWMTKTTKSGLPHKENPLRNFYLIPRYNFPDDWAEQLEGFKDNIKSLEELN